MHTGEHNDATRNMQLPDSGRLTGKDPTQGGRLTLPNSGQMDQKRYKDTSTGVVMGNLGIHCDTWNSKSDQHLDTCIFPTAYKTRQFFL
ncbi:hypothetical protein ElyMa_006251800 [Elysia marginata]|uniref:Uncharacterized protein n=1 Tax=Elysia marginata TaxID=1093978 RepID=A0AAV4HD81_9GAST|nr:hypothetical protein ElyMa_006251800 [Elysia marginata]